MIVQYPLLQPLPKLSPTASPDQPMVGVTMLNYAISSPSRRRLGVLPV